MNSSDIERMEASEIADAMYEKAGGPTDGLRRVYGAFVENEHQRNAAILVPSIESTERIARMLWVWFGRPPGKTWEDEPHKQAWRDKAMALGLAVQSRIPTYVQVPCHD